MKIEKKDRVVKKERKLLQKFILLLVGLTLGLLLAEISIKFLEVKKVLNLDESIITDTRIFSSGLGYINKPYSSRTHTLGEYKTTWIINKLGFRDFEYSLKKLPGAKRILVLGDSMVFGMGVESLESFPKILETKINQSTQSGSLTEVLNMGILGYGPLEYKNLYLGLGKKFNPDLIIVGFFLGNDSLDSLWVDLNKRYIFLKALPDELISYDNNQWLKEHSKLWIFLLQKYYSWVETQNIDTLKLVFNSDVKGQMLRQVQIEPTNYYMKKSWKITNDALNKLAFEANINKTKLVFLILPTKEQIIPDEWIKVKNSGHNVNERLYSDSGSRKEMLKLCEINSWNCLDLQDVMREQKNPKALFLKDDFHLSREGNEFVSSTLLNYLSQKNLLEY